MIAVQAKGEIELYRMPENDPDAEWILDSRSSEECENKIGLARQGMHLVENIISPHGRYIMICTNGVKIHKFKRERQGDKDRIVLVETDWTLPSKIDDFETVELAKRVRFEARNVIRILTEDNRDIMYQLLPD